MNELENAISFMYHSKAIQHHHVADISPLITKDKKGFIFSVACHDRVVKNLVPLLSFENNSLFGVLKQLQTLSLGNITSCVVSINIHILPVVWLL